MEPRLQTLGISPPGTEQAQEGGEGSGGWRGGCKWKIISIKAKNYCGLGNEGQVSWKGNGFCFHRRGMNNWYCSILLPLFSGLMQKWWTWGLRVCQREGWAQGCGFLFCWPLLFRAWGPVDRIKLRAAPPTGETQHHSPLIINDSYSHISQSHYPSS